MRREDDERPGRVSSTVPSRLHSPAVWGWYSSVVSWTLNRRERVAVGSDMAETARGPIDYAAVGDGPPVLVHGAGGGFDQALDFGELPLQSGFRVIAPSRFGYLRRP